MDAAFQFSDMAQVYPYVAARKMSTPTSGTRSTIRTPVKLELPLITSEEAATYLTGRRVPDVLIFIDKQPYFHKRVPRTKRVQATEYSVVMLAKFGKTQMRILYPAVVSKHVTCVPVIRKRASSFHLSPDAFERLRDFATSFVETIRTWLREICSKPHFLDKTWDVCDLEEECAHRHHVIIPYFRKATHGPFPGVLMCRKCDIMDDLVVRVVFFDVKDLKVKDHEDNVLNSFHDVWSNFVGIPSPKKDDRPPGSDFDSKSFFNFLDPKRHTPEIHIKHLKELQSYMAKNLHRLSHQKASELELLLANLVGLLFSPNITVVNLTAHVLADLCVWKVPRIGEQIYGMWMKLMDDKELHCFGFRGLDALLNLESTNTLVKWLCNFTDCAIIVPELLKQSKAISSIEKYRESVMLQVERQYHKQATWSEKQLKEDSDDSSSYCDTVDTHETWPGCTSSLWGPGKEKAVIPRLKLSLARRRGLSSSSGVEAQWTPSGDRDQRRDDMMRGTSHELNKKAVHDRMKEMARESGEGLLMNDLSALVKRKQESELKKEMLKHEAGVKRRSERQRIFKREEHSDGEFAGEDTPLKISLQGKPPTRVRLKFDMEQVIRWRKIRLNGIRILSRLVACDPERLHPIIPVSAIYVMLSWSCSLSGASVVSLAHFLPDKDLSAEQHTVGHLSDRNVSTILCSDYDNCAEDRKAILFKTLESAKKPRMCVCSSDLLLKSTSKSTSPPTGRARAQRSPITRSSSSSSTSLSSPKEKVACTCFAPLLSTALWSLLKSYSDAIDVKLGNLERGSRNAANCWANQRDAGQVRNKLDCFISRVERGIRDLLPALDSTKDDAFSFYRLGHVLLFAAQYLINAKKPQVTENAFFILSYSLLCVKSQLMKDIVKTRFVPSRIFLWIAYAFLAAVLMDNTSVRIAEGVLSVLLDFDEKGRLLTSSGRSTSSRLLRTPSAKRYLPHSIQSPGVPYNATPLDEERIAFRDILTQIIEYVLVSPRAENILTKHWGIKRFDHCRCRALSYIQSIATVVWRNKDSLADDTQWLQRPKEMMADFNHMVPAIRHWLDTVHAADNSIIPTLSKSSTCRREVKLVLLNCERCLFSTWIQSEPLDHGRHKQMLESYVRNHFFSFIKIYHTGRWANVQDTMDVLLCRMHGRALIALSNGTAAARDVFNHLGVVPFLLGEINLEYNMKKIRSLKTQQKKKHGVATPSGNTRWTQQMLVFLESANFDVKAEIADFKVIDSDVKNGYEDATVTQPNFATSLPQPPFIAAMPPKLPPPPAHAKAMPSLPPPPDPVPTLPVSTLPPVPQTAAAKWAAKQGLPKLSFSGVRASVQGSGCIGAAPAEEPGLPEEEKPPMLGEIPNATVPTTATLTASPRTDTDSDDTSQPSQKPPLISNRLGMPAATPEATPPETPQGTPLPLRPSMGSNVPKVPKISFKGVRASVQGAGCIGAAPSEEPGIPEGEKPPMLGDIPDISLLYGATTSASPETDNDLDDDAVDPSSRPRETPRSGDDHTDTPPGTPSVGTPEPQRPAPLTEGGPSTVTSSSLRPLMGSDIPKVPKISFKGVRASVQGAGCIGAAPAEEPDVPESEKPPMLGDIPASNILNGATPSASLRTGTDMERDTSRTATPPETPAGRPGAVTTPSLIHPPIGSDTLKVPRLFFKGARGTVQGVGSSRDPFAEESSVTEKATPSAMLGDVPSVYDVSSGATPIGSQRTDTAHSSMRGQMISGLQTARSEIFDRVGPVKGFPIPPALSPPPLNVTDGQQLHCLSQRTPRIREDISLTGAYDGEVAKKKTRPRSVRRRKSHGASPTSPLPKSLTRSESLEGLSDTPHTSTLSAGGSYAEEGPNVAFNVFYFQQRSMRNLYFDQEVHLLMLTLLFTLLLTPKRRLLDSRYCDRNAVLNHKEDIPDILAHHLNHQMNTSVLKNLPSALDDLGLEGFRFLKLLCPVMNKKWSYEKAETIASGAFGTVVEISSGFANPKSTARKILRKYGNYGQSLFVDTFNEVSCMETGRFANNVCEIFDYGIDESCYWIIMRYYPTTLRKYREKLLPKGEPVTEEKVTELLGYFGQVVNAVQTLHTHGLYHYDLKCDNIMLDTTQKFNGARDELAIGAGDNTEINLFGGLHYAALGDFGESRLLEDMSDEWDRRNRGTECIKAPEMLVVDIQKPEIDSFDRRKNVGTNQGADVWSLGCLFFECLTGEYLFRQDFPAFYCNLTKGETFEQLLGSDNTDMILGLTGEQPSDQNRNGSSDKGECPIWRPSLLAFMRFLLNRNQQRRPDISLVVTHFIQLYNEVKEKIEMSSYYRENRWTWKMSGRSFNVTPRENAVTPIRQSERREQARCASPQQSSQDTLGSKAGGVVVPQVTDTNNCQKISPKGESRFTQIFKDLYLVEIAMSDSGEAAYLAQEREWTAALDFRSVTSVAAEAVLPLKRAEVYRVPWKGDRNGYELTEHFPVIFDFLRSCCTRGATLLIDGSESPASDGSVAMGLVVALVAEHLKIIYFRAMASLESQMVVTTVRSDITEAINAWVDERQNTWVEEKKSLRVSCLCGCVEWSFRRSSINLDSSSTVVYIERCDCDKSVAARCPNNRDCAAIASDFEKECRIAEENVHWIWAQNYSRDVTSLNVSQGAVVNSELKDCFENENGSISKRFRCRNCRMMTHVITDASIAVVCLCEMYRCRAARAELRESDFEKSLYEKLRFRWRSLTSFLVPRKQTWLRQKRQSEERATTMR